MIVKAVKVVVQVCLDLETSEKSIEKSIEKSKTKHTVTRDNLFEESSLRVFESPPPSLLLLRPPFAVERLLRHFPRQQRWSSWS